MQNQTNITKLVKIKFLGSIKDAIAVAIQVIPCLDNKDYIKRVITFYPDEDFFVTEKEADWLLNIQKKYKFARVFND
jgi:hypothetical protein